MREAADFFFSRDAGRARGGGRAVAGGGESLGAFFLLKVFLSKLWSKNGGLPFEIALSNRPRSG